MVHKEKSKTKLEEKKRVEKKRLEKKQEDWSG